MNGFRVLDRVDTGEASATVRRMRAVLDHMVTGDLGLDRATQYVRSLVDGQQGEGFLRDGSWCVLPNQPMPKDARADFAFLPTYLALAILVRWLHMGGRDVPGVQQALRRGCAFAALTNIEGHGYDARSFRLEGLEVLFLGKVVPYVMQNPDVGGALIDTLKQVRAECVQLMMQGQTESGWGRIPAWMWVEPVLGLGGPDRFHVREAAPGVRATVEAVHAKKPGADEHTGRMAWQLGCLTGAASVVAAVSRNEVDLNRLPVTRRARDLWSEHRGHLARILDHAHVLERGKVQGRWLHLSLHGMRDEHGWDMEVGTREPGRPVCHPAVKDRIVDFLGSAGYSVRDNHVFVGDEVLEKHVYDGGFGRGYDVVQLEIRRGVRETPRVVDVLADLVRYATNEEAER